MKSTIQLNECEYNKNGRFIKAASECFAAVFPQEIEVVSHYTGEIIMFKPDREAAERNEFWDGEMMEYIPMSRLQNVDKLIVYHAH